MIILDVETTGTDYSKHAIVSIGALEFEKPSNTFYLECRVFNGALVNDYALTINGFTKEQVFKTNEFSLCEAVKVFNDWLRPVRERTIAGENPRFDLDFMRDSYERCKREWCLGYRTVDLHTISTLYFKLNELTLPVKRDSLTSSLSLDNTLVSVGLPEEPKPHNALNGAKLEAEAYSRMVYGRKLLDEYLINELPAGRKHLL